MEQLKVHTINMASRMELNDSLQQLVDYVRAFNSKWKCAGMLMHFHSIGWFDFYYFGLVDKSAKASPMAADLNKTKWLSCVKQLLQVTKVCGACNRI